jgi:hypothetical protein
MQLRRYYLLLGLLAAMRLPAAENAQITIIDTGSTNRPGLQVTTDANGSARVEGRGVEPHAMQLNSELCQRLLANVQAAAPLHALPAAHCIKSVSFGSRLFIEYNGDRSPDLNCPVQQDPTVESLKEQALAILKTAKPNSARHNR